MTQSFVTVAIPFPANNRPAVIRLLQSLGNPLEKKVNEPDVKLLLDDTAIIHFISITALPAAENETTTHLVIEVTADGEAGPALRTLSAVLGATLLDIFRVAEVELGGRPLAKFLAKRRIKVGLGWFSEPGLNFGGTPGMSVVRIRQEADLAARIAGLLEVLPRSGSALAALESVRAALWDKAEKWAFVPEPAPILGPTPPALAGLLPVLGSAIATFLWPFLLLAILPLLSFLLRGVLPHWLSPIAGAAGFSTALWVGVIIVVAELMTGLAVYFRLRAREQSENGEDIPPEKDDVDAIMQRENYTFQNHMAAQSRMKPGVLRSFALRIGLWAAAMVGRYFSQPSFLGPTGVIHFARWVRIPKTDKLLFMSNYDGAWESYLENFIQEAHQGVSGIWSNTVGFPKTSNLFFDGASDGNRLRRWTRRQQYPSYFWYSAYPKLTLARIRLNAAIRQGIALATTEEEAADWLACFGSAPRPADELEVDEIPTLAFGGLRRLRHGAGLLLVLPDKDVARCREWLRKVAPVLSYGDHRIASSAHVLGYSASGLRKLGLTSAQMATFPVPFQDGMSAPWRARALGDQPETWSWGGSKNVVDAIMLVYAADPSELVQSIDSQCNEARQFGITVDRKFRFADVPDDGPMREAFGFIDGISQPVLRGAGRWTAAKYRDQLIEPGEIILGYRDGSGQLPPSPTVAASDDPENLLAARDPTLDRQRPDFSVPLPTGDRDLGQNGTFLVTRQLEQDKTAFSSFLKEAAEKLGREKRLPPGLELPPEEWIAAKMTGRWRKDGSSLVRHPDRPACCDLPRSYAGPPLEPDNAFRFATEDATGRRCPFGAHIRRANPRDSFASDPNTALDIANRHRILRVGRSYLPETGSENPGLLFLCLNSDIERQFEFVQQTWLLGPSFQGLEDELDPIIGGRGAKSLFTIPTREGPVRLKGLKDFVRVKGGGYFFVPGRRAVRFLSLA